MCQRTVMGSEQPLLHKRIPNALSWLGISLAVEGYVGVIYLL